MTDRERLAAILADMSPELFAEQVSHCRDYWLGRADRAMAQGVTLPEPPAPAPPKPTWEPSGEVCKLLTAWCLRMIHEPSRPFLRRLYAQLHRDRVAALPSPAWDDPDPGFATVRARSGESVSIQRRHLLALADDGTGT